MQYFQNNIYPQISLTDFMHCKQEVKEKVVDFMDRYKYLHSQIAYHVSDGDVKIVLINNLQKDIRDNIYIFYYTSFIHLCM